MVPIKAPATEKEAQQLAALVDWTKAKAIWGAVSTALVAALLMLWAVLPDGLTGQEVIQVILAALGVGGVGGGVVYNIPNKAKPKPPDGQ